MKLHILGICGTFMGGLALLARELGAQVSGSDRGVYPPMSEQLAAAGITVTEGFDAAQLDTVMDEVVVGNAMTRGNPCVERLLDEKRALISGPAWLERHVLRGRTVLAVAGTHGKTSTASMLAFILERAGLRPGFLIGGVPSNFGVCARLGSGRMFVVEADEYDTAFFDKRSKFVHYRADVLVVNNLEFDHADIFRDLDDIRRQFHHAVRLVPRAGTVVALHDDDDVEQLLQMGCYSHVQRFGAGPAAPWSLQLRSPDARCFDVLHTGQLVGSVSWPLIGRHNALNALAAVCAAAAVGVEPRVACDALAAFLPPRRRLERFAEISGITLYDDFAHHPTAIAATLAALRSAVGEAPIVAVLDPASNTMRRGVHRDTLGPSLGLAQRVLLHDPDGTIPGLEVAREHLRGCGIAASIHDGVDDIVEVLARTLRGDEHVLIMSNAGFGGIHHRLEEVLRNR
jgi:UDP-N-acetylmuramate: L-alanyl-gamma-D-glutamyl-meso-diaminopimelate ligase